MSVIHERYAGGTEIAQKLRNLNATGSLKDQNFLRIISYKCPFIKCLKKACQSAKILSNLHHLPNGNIFFNIILLSHLNKVNNFIFDWIKPCQDSIWHRQDCIHFDTALNYQLSPACTVNVHISLAELANLIICIISTRQNKEFQFTNIYIYIHRLWNSEALSKRKKQINFFVRIFFFFLTLFYSRLFIQSFFTSITVSMFLKTCIFFLPFEWVV